MVAILGSVEKLLLLLLLLLLIVRILLLGFDDDDDDEYVVDGPVSILLAVSDNSTGPMALG